MTMTTVTGRVVVTVLLGHGLLHLLGAAKGFAWAEVSQLREPIDPGAALLWLLAAVLVIECAVFVALGPGSAEARVCGGGNGGFSGNDCLRRGRAVYNVSGSVRSPSARKLSEGAVASGRRRAAIGIWP